jgi:hypothetical protein
MQQELARQGARLAQICEDRDGYYRADRLLKETELVLGGDLHGHARPGRNGGDMRAPRKATSSRDS